MFPARISAVPAFPVAYVAIARGSGPGPKTNRDHANTFRWKNLVWLMRRWQVVLDNLLNNAWKYTSNAKIAEIEFGFTEEETGAVYFARTMAWDLTRVTLIDCSGPASAYILKASFRVRASGWRPHIELSANTAVRSGREGM